MRHRRGTVSLVVVLLVFYLVVYGRAVLHEGGPPAFFVEERPGVTVLLDKGFPSFGVYQFSDGSTPADVIELTGRSVAPELSKENEVTEPLGSGEALSILCTNSKVVEIKREWMPAPYRMAIGIALDPDRMNELDWQALPGIGVSLAKRIEEDRQCNGDFGSLEAVQRVKGIGARRIEAWKKYF